MHCVCMCVIQGRIHQIEYAMEAVKQVCKEKGTQSQDIWYRVITRVVACVCVCECVSRGYGSCGKHCWGRTEQNWSTDI